MMTKKEDAAIGESKNRNFPSCDEVRVEMGINTMTFSSSLFSLCL
jgi:hypothetical protein